jgi:hypothetical protein
MREAFPGRVRRRFGVAAGHAPGDGETRILLSHRYRFIYLKTAKTAGTSVEAYFEPLCVPDPETHVVEHLTEMRVSDAGVIGERSPRACDSGVPFFNHMHAADVRDRVGEEIWSRYMKFANVRNPFDKVVSAFWMDHQYDPVLAAEPVDFAVVKARFRDWVEETDGRGSFDRPIYTIDGAIVVDRLLRYETLARDVEAVRQALGAPELAPMPRYKAGVRRSPAPFADYYDARSRDLVAEVFAWELENLGYPPLHVG